MTPTATEPTVEVLPDASALATRVATELLARIVAAQASGEEPQIALTGGTIADAIHHEVSRLVPGSGVDWSRVGIWWGDERFVAANSPDRNAGQARAALLDQVPIPADHVHEVPASDQAADPDAAAAAYSSELRAFGGGEFAVLMLGVGPDGHIASLFPGFPQVEVEDKIAVGVTGSPKPPPERVSLTLPALNHSRAVWFVASGEGKAAAVAAALDPSAADPLPAARVRGHGETVWFLDAASAGDL